MLGQTSRRLPPRLRDPLSFIFVSIEFIGELLNCSFLDLIWRMQFEKKKRTNVSQPMCAEECSSVFDPIEDHERSLCTLLNDDPSSKLICIRVHLAASTC